MAVNLKANSWSQTFGNKVKQGVELAGTAKAVWDTGKMIYAGVQAVSPYIVAAMV
jgi:hypothetical protein